MKELELSNRARDELTDIYLYTLETFGRRQADRYLDQIRPAFHLLRRFPELGRPKDKLRPGLRAYGVGRHQILYSVADHINVEGIPHDSRDLDAYVRTE